ncbi:MAG: hypothetical protein JST42_22070 [Bacteroidetes bacterium]|nr:hypothetical protein [Bacteroidota bacterium]
MNKFLIYMLILFAFAGCYKDSDYDAATLSSGTVIGSMQAGRNMLLATGSDTTQITIELPVNASDSGSLVSLSASSGTFLESSKSYLQVKTALIKDTTGPQRRLARATYQSSDTPGVATIGVYVASVYGSFTISLQRNYADSLKIVPSILSLNEGAFSEMTFVVNLTSKKGKVTPGQQVTLSIKDDANTPRGTIRTSSPQSNDSGQASFVYDLVPDSAFFGRLKVVARSPDNAATPADSTYIYIIKH